MPLYVQLLAHNLRSNLEVFCFDMKQLPRLHTLTQWGLTPATVEVNSRTNK